MRKMKDSGIEWIGQIPENWEVTKYGRCVRRIKEYDDNPNKQVLSLTIKGVKVKDLSDNMGKLALDYTGHQIVKKGNLVVTPRDFDCTPILSGIAPCDGCISNLYFILESNGQVYLPYINHQMWGVKYGGDIWKKLSFGMRYSYNYQQFSDIPLAIPPLEEQELIADYLDEKVQQIDNIISKTQKTIEEYKKYKQSVITETVTKGLNPNVEMKDSGIEWIGEIPKHWNRIKLKNLSLIISKGTTPTTIGKDISEFGRIRFLKAENIQNSNVVKYPEFFIDEDTNKLLSRSQLCENDILFVIAGATIGKVAILNKEFLPANTNQAVCFIRLKPQVNTKFIWYYLQSNCLKEEITLSSVQSAQPNISMGSLGNIIIPQPNDIEQNEIVIYLNQKCNEIDKLITQKQELINQLETYKKSLIYECVTGKKEVLPAYAY